MRDSIGALGVAAALAVGGCGATSFRLALAPTVDTRRQAGFEATLSVAAGWPLDYHGQSHHYLQGRSGAGVAVAEGSGGAQWLMRAEVDSLHWVLPRVDVRAGAGLARRFASDGVGAESRRSWSAAGFLALLPVIRTNEGGHPGVYQLCVGPELRAEALFSDDGSRRGVFSLPLLIELNLLMAGD